MFALLWRARMIRHVNAASHVPSDMAGEHDTPTTPVFVRPRGRAPTSESGVREHTPRSRCLAILPPSEEACRQLQLFTYRHRPKRSCLNQSTDLTVGVRWLRPKAAGKIVTSGWLLITIITAVDIILTARSIGCQDFSA